MYRIIRKEPKPSGKTSGNIHIAHKAEPGQFIILRVDREGERVPFTIADFDREKEPSP